MKIFYISLFIFGVIICNIIYVHDIKKIIHNGNFEQIKLDWKHLDNLQKEQFKKMVLGDLK